MGFNLLPAILLAGPPHSGKSVLAYLLSQRLRRLGKAHYLLRAVPDGEGDWFFEGDSALVRLLRLGHKQAYTPRFLAHMQAAIEQRQAPLLVDVGGRPQGEAQFNLLRACTHGILLYRSEAERLEWRARLEDIQARSLLLIAELRSERDGGDRLEQRTPRLQGVISGLARQAERRAPGETFAALVELAAGICHYDQAFLEAQHLRAAPPYPLQVERRLFQQLPRAAGLPEQPAPWWEPADLAELEALLPARRAAAIYGRGPAWLAARLALRAGSAPVSLFDIRYGWLKLPRVIFSRRGALAVEAQPFQALQAGAPPGADAVERGWLLRLDLPPGGVLEPGPLRLPEPPPGGVVLSGRLPRWAFAALARRFAARRAWVGIDYPNESEKIVVVVHSASPALRVGDRLARPDGV